MDIALNHTIVPAHDKSASAAFYARILGFRDEGSMSHFAVVRVNEALTLDFDDRENFEPLHYAFKVSDETFDRIFAKLQAESLPYGSGPRSLDDGQINRHAGGRGVYFRDPSGHILELLTAE